MFAKSYNVKSKPEIVRLKNAAQKHIIDKKINEKIKNRRLTGMLLGAKSSNSDCIIGGMISIIKNA